MFENRTVIVTGGSRGIGLATAKAFSEAGANVMICARGEAALREAAESLSPKPAAWKTLDVSDEASVQALMAETIERFGGIDVLVNNAGITRDMFLLKLKAEDFDAAVSVNLRGTFLCTKAASRQMMRQKRGRIVNLTSVAGEAGNMGQAAYSASKAGVIGLTKASAKELARYGVTVNAVSPGLIETEMTAAIEGVVKEEILKAIPLGRFGTPEETAKLILFLASDDAAYITGQTFRIDGGLLM